MKKKDVLSIIDSLEKVNKSIARNLEANVSVPTEALADCQDAAIAVGNEIEKQGQVGEETVHLLEAYCENIYQMNCQQEDIGKCRKLTKKIQKQLVQIRNQVKYDLPDDRKQVVFLPYKASMWDSLESVWEAADADPDCDAYVIPIPYYDRNLDGSLGEMHYEGNQYPENVPVMWYEDYDFAVNKPDVIFIHNPYDKYNHVTSVHPFFYSNNLKQFTDKLVYIPYFILNEVDPHNEEAVGYIEHFCTVPAVMYADYVIVQSEAMRRIYINSMVKLLGEKDIPKSHWEKKILGLGSPKVDKVLSVRKEETELPEEWINIIQRPGGSFKKIILYNTSVSALLYYSDRMLEKMKTVFEIFRKNHDIVALLWRPHPLTHATIKSMRPQLWEEYSRMEEQYKREGWGIYDDTADMDRAIAVSDAYYGDKSSLVQLYQKTGKPIMIQNVEILNEE